MEHQAALFFIPVLLALLASGIAVIKPPGPRLKSAVQHFAAGLVFAAVALELLPEVAEGGHRVAMILGFAAGVGAMLLVKALTHGHSEQGSKAVGALLFAVALDLFLDGLLLGLASSSEGDRGVALLVALSLEVGFLALSLTTTLKDTGRSGLAALFPVGALGGWLLLGQMSGAPLIGFLSFSVAALLYLVTEELLAEAHEVEDTPVVTAMFFVGFLCILLLESGGH
jgi:ZIP family zinc transporter